MHLTLLVRYTKTVLNTVRTVRTRLSYCYSLFYFIPVLRCYHTGTILYKTEQFHPNSILSGLKGWVFEFAFEKAFAKVRLELLTQMLGRISNDIPKKVWFGCRKQTSEEMLTFNAFKKNTKNVLRYVLDLRVYAVSGRTTLIWYKCRCKLR